MLAVTGAVQSLLTANVIPNSLSRSTMMKLAIRSSETSALTRAMQRHISGDDILFSQSSEIFKTYSADYVVNFVL
jgi:hypothetical protein